MKLHRPNDKVGRSIEESTPDFAFHKSVDGNAPNIVVIYFDDLGYSDFGCFGSEIKTPNIDALAADGLRFTNYTTHPICSPARAALLTGRHAHNAATGFLANTDAGFPGYRGEIPTSVPTLAEYLRNVGYSTFMVGKWHNTNYANAHPAACKESWPCQRGFEHFYGFIGGDCSYFHPARIMVDNTVKKVDQYPEGYYASDDWTSNAIGMVNDHVSHSSEKPFFLYMAYNAPHGPLQAKEEDIAKYEKLYAEGWGAAIQNRVTRQIELGMFDGSIMRDFKDELSPNWDDIEPENQRLMARYMAVYAAMIDSVDQNIGRVVKHLKDLDLHKNTIFVLTSDNGAASGGGDAGMLYSSRRFSGLGDVPDVAQSGSELGSGKFDPLVPTAWAQVSNAPFHEFKTQTGGGGRRVPFVFSWGNGISGTGDIRNQFIHVTDIFPTLREIVESSQAWDMSTVAAADQDGISFLDVATHNAPSKRDSQYYECWSNRAYQDGDWVAVSTQARGQEIDYDNWRLFNVAEDFAEHVDLADEFPIIRDKLADAFDNAALENNVYPLDNRSAKARFNQKAPQLQKLLLQPKSYFPGADTIHHSFVMPMIYDRSFRITAQFDYDIADEGVIWALGDAFAGIVLFVEAGAATVHYNGHGELQEFQPMPLNPGKQVVDFHFAALGDRKGRAKIYINDILAHEDMDVFPTIMAGSLEGLDIGVDRRGPVSWSLHERRAHFPYGSSIARVTIDPMADQPS